MSALAFSVLMAGAIVPKPTPEPSTPPHSPPEIVVTVHGLGRSMFSLVWLGRQFSRQGYEVISVSYPSTRQSVESSAATLQRKLKARLEAPHGRVHFVTHSLGGIVVRAYLQQDRPANLGRVVMLGPPNQGSELADRLRRNPLYRWATGPAGQELGTDADSTPIRLGPVDYEVGIIAGRVSGRLLASVWIPDENDGKVSVRRAAVAGMRDLVVISRGHTFLPQSRKVADQALHFIAHGCFLK